MRPLCALSILAILAISPPAFADDELGVTRNAETDTANLASDSAFIPGMLRAGSDGQGFAVASTTVNGAAASRVQVDAHGEVNMFGPVRLVLSVQDAFHTNAAKPGIGIGVKLLDEARFGVSATGYIQYKAEGFAEPEGEVEAVIAFGKRFGDLRTAIDFSYGQDPEGSERDGEVAVSGQYQLTGSLFTGVTAHYRDALGATKEPIVRDAVGGATATFTYNRFAFTALAGLGMVELQNEPRKIGAIGTLAIGTAF
jgi:hypothetical protein